MIVFVTPVVVTVAALYQNCLKPILVYVFELLDIFSIISPPFFAPETL